MSRQAFSSRNRIRLIKNGDDFVDANLDLINNAKEKILFHTYIFEEDEVTEPVIEAFIRRAREGIKVYFIIDAFGSPELSPQLKTRFEEAGVKHDFFAPLFGKRFDHIGRRLHQKLLLIDNHKAITGGINMAKKFICPESGKPWLDYSVLIEGEEVYRLQKKVLKLYTKSFPQEKSYLRRSMEPAPLETEQGQLARTVVNDFMRFQTEIYQSFLEAIRGARSSIKITATYFLPGKKLLRELKNASKRGVKIELIFGVFSDHPVERWSSKHLYSWYLGQGLRIYEWGDSILHAKAALIDDDWVSIGSYNHNYLSRYACLELSVEAQDKSFAQTLEQEFDYIKERSHEISPEAWKREICWYHTCFYFLTYAFSNVVTFLSLFFIVRKKEKVEL